MLPLTLLGGLPWRLIGAVAACVGLLATGAYAEHWRAGRAAAIQQAEELAQALEAQQEAQRITARLNAKSQEVQDAYAKRAQIARVDADAARIELDRLLDSLKAPISADPTAAASGVAGAAAVYSDVLGSCASTLTRLAREADERGEKLTALQEWVKAVLK